MPSLVDTVRDLITEYEKKLDDLGKEYENPRMAMIEIINSFSKLYIDRTYTGHGVEFNINDMKMSPAAEISMEFHDEYVEELDKVEPLKGYNLNSIRALLRSKTVCSFHHIF